MNCALLHHWIWSWVEMPAGNGKTYRYWRGKCKFCDLFSNRPR